MELEGGKIGLVYISEVVDNYVKDINDILIVGDEVIVKVMNIGDDGKIGLFICKVVDCLDCLEKSYDCKLKYSKKFVGNYVKLVESFEDIMFKFLKDSDERFIIIKC